MIKNNISIKFPYPVFCSLVENSEYFLTKNISSYRYNETRLKTSKVVPSSCMCCGFAVSSLPSRIISKYGIVLSKKCWNCGCLNTFN